MEQKHISEVAALRQQIELEYQAALRGLHGLASGIARHDFINARYQRLHGIHQELTDLVGTREATGILVNTIIDQENKPTEERKPDNEPPTHPISANEPPTHKTV